MIRRILPTVTHNVQGRLAKAFKEARRMHSDSPDVRAFVESAIHWCRSGTQNHLLAMIRSPLSGVPHDIGAAYATLASRTGALLDAIDAQRLALPAPDRDAMLRFAARARRISATAESVED